MSSDPLPLPEVWSDLPDGTTDESARGELAASGHSGLALIEYASGYAQPDPQPLARPLNRVEQPAANNERLPSLVPAALAKGLADLAAIVTQAEGLLRAQATLKGDTHFAVERIHDVAMALRMRGVDAALCDTLEASVREVGDAVVRHEAAATGALSAAALLRDVMRRTEDLKVVAVHTAATDAEPPVRSSATEARATREPPAPWIIDVALGEPAPSAAEVSREEAQPQAPSPGAEADTADGAKAEPADTPVARSLDDSTVDDEQMRALREMVLDDESGEDAVSEPQAIAAPPAAALKIAAADDDASAPEVVEPTGSTAMGAANDEVVAPTESMTAGVSQPQQAGNVAPAADEPGNAAARAALAAETPGFAIPETRGEQEPPQRASSLRVSESGTVAATKLHRPENDPLAALYGLSEEELIALFC